VLVAHLVTANHNTLPEGAPAVAPWVMVGMIVLLLAGAAIIILRHRRVASPSV
jgi:hypothetical protein